jgi:hypothetical protein
MLKIDMTSFAGNMVATNVIKTTKVNKIVKANEDPPRYSLIDQD